MKLHSIKMINSGNFSFANLLLDADSIQLAGRNNRGKTSLLWTLLFLFVVDRKQATHPDYELKESLHFYFRDPEKSYIVFEGYDEKRGYFYMLLKRESDTVKYYFVDKEFHDEFLIRNDKVLAFHEVLENPSTGLKSPLRDITEILARTITSKKGELGFLRLERGKNSRRFSELYKHLFRATKQDDNLLRNGILVALGLQGEMVDFGKEIGHDTRSEWQKRYKEIKGLTEIKEKLDPLKERRKSLNEAEVALKREVVKYDTIDFTAILALSKKEINDAGEAIQSKQNEVKRLYPQEEEARKKRDGINKTITQQELLLKQEEALLSRALSYGEEGWILQEIENTKTEQYRIRKIIEGISTAGTRASTQTKLDKLKKTREAIVQYIENEKNLLLMNISNDKGEIELAHAVLSEDIQSLPKEAIKSPTSTVKANTFLFNHASIDISDIDIQPLPTVEEKRRELKEIEVSITELEEVLKHIEEKEKLEESYTQISSALASLYNKHKEIKQIDYYKKKISHHEELILEATESRIKVDRLIDSFKIKKRDLENEKEMIALSRDAMRKRADKLFAFKILFDEAIQLITYQSPPYKEYVIDEVEVKIRVGISSFEDAIRELSSAQHDLEAATDMVRLALRGVELKSDSPEDLIVELEERCYGIEIREKELEEMVKVGFNTFFQRIKKFLSALEVIKIYILQINKVIAKYQISNLSGVVIRQVRNEDQINILDSINSEEIDLFWSLDERYEDLEDTEDFFIQYIRKEKIIRLEDLFSITIDIEKNKKRETSQQSNGTKRMLHVMLLLVLMREMIHKEDTIPFLIDEVADIDSTNQAQLLSFFKELNLLPISASPHVSHEFEKIYRIEEINEKSFLDDKTSTRKIQVSHHA